MVGCGRGRLGNPVEDLYAAGGVVPATVVELFDNVPVNSTYVAETTTLDGAPIGQPDGGVFPLEGRLLIGNNGVLDPGEDTGLDGIAAVDGGRTDTADDVLCEHLPLRRSRR